MDGYDVCIVGGGVAGLTASTFTARAGLSTLVVDGGGSILRRNAHLENFPGFPFGVDARRLLERLRLQAERAGAAFRDGLVTSVEREASTGAFAVAVDDDPVVRANRVVAASWSDASYLPGDVESEQRGSKTFVDVDPEGRTTVDGVYAAGRLADRYHQAVVCAGHGATVGVTVVHDSDEHFYHDWVVPEGYFTERGREVPPGCEEIPETEWEARDERAREANAAYAAAFEDSPDQHPSVAGE